MYKLFRIYRLVVAMWKSPRLIEQFEGAANWEGELYAMQGDRDLYIAFIKNRMQQKHNAANIDQVVTDEIIETEKRAQCLSNTTVP